MSRIYYASALIVVLLFWLAIGFIPLLAVTSGGAGGLTVFVIFGALVAYAAIRCAISAYQGHTGGRVGLVIFAVLAGFYLYINIDIKLHWGRYLDPDGARNLMIALVVLLVSHAALIMRGRAGNTNAASESSETTDECAEEPEELEW